MRQAEIEEIQTAADKKETFDESPDSLRQLIDAFSRGAMMGSLEHADDPLYIAFSKIMSQSCHAEDEDDDDDDSAGDPGTSFQV